MGLLNRLGLQRPGPPRCSAERRFQLTDVAIINPMHERRGGATIQLDNGTIAGLSDTSAEASSGFAGCLALPGLVDMHVHLPPDNALKLTQGAALLYLAHGEAGIGLEQVWKLATRAVIAAGRLYRVADLDRALRSSASYFASPLIKPLTHRGAERALERALGRATA